MNMKKNWNNAREYCQKVTGPSNPGNGELMSIHNEKENGVMNHLQRQSYIFSMRSYWIGLNRQDNEGK